MSTIRKRFSALLVGTIFSAGFFAVTNPPPAEHARVIYESFSELHPLYQPLGFSGRASSRASYRSLFLASLTTHHGQLTSLGLLGQVWVFPEGFLVEAEARSPSAVVTPNSVYAQ